MYKNYFKRFCDFWIALIALICISPILLVVTVWLHFANKGNNNLNVNDNPNERKGWLKRWLAPAIFTQERPGLHGKIFKVIKFRTMTDERDADGKLLPDVERLTKVGKFVRSTSIDELPQLINVLKGDMALIGPRPLTPVYLYAYNDFQRRRMEVRPGISGWAQVNGRMNLKLSKKFEYDVWYVDHCSLWTDIKIIFITIWNVLRRKDIGEGSGSMDEIDDLGFATKFKELEENHIL